MVRRLVAAEPLDIDQRHAQTGLVAEDRGKIVDGGVGLLGAERTHLRDVFGQLRLREGRYTAGQIDTRWTDAIEADYTQYLQANLDRLTLPRPIVQEILNERLNPPPAPAGGRGGRGGAPGRGAPPG